MTMTTYRGDEQPNVRSSASDSYFQRPYDMFVVLRNTWLRRRTERVLEALPTEIRKDIGWPAPKNGKHG